MHASNVRVITLYLTARCIGGLETNPLGAIIF